MATKPEFLVAKEKMLVALATVSAAISSPVITIIRLIGRQCMHSRRMRQCYINIAIAKTSRGCNGPAVRIKGTSQGENMIKDKNKNKRKNIYTTKKKPA